MNEAEKGIPLMSEVSEEDWDKTNRAPGYIHYNDEQKAAAKYEAEQRKERRQQMKLQCIGLAISTASSNKDMEILSENVLKAAKSYYAFVRT